MSDITEDDLETIISENNSSQYIKVELIQNLYVELRNKLQYYKQEISKTKYQIEIINYILSQEIDII